MTDDTDSNHDVEKMRAEAERMLLQLDHQDRVLDGLETQLTAQVAEMRKAARAAGLDSDEALEQALASMRQEQAAQAADAPAAPAATATHPGAARRAGRMV